MTWFENDYYTEHNLADVLTFCSMMQHCRSSITWCWIISMHCPLR